MLLVTTTMMKMSMMAMAMVMMMMMMMVVDVAALVVAMTVAAGRRVPTLPAWPPRPPGLGSLAGGGGCGHFVGRGRPGRLSG